MGITLIQKSDLKRVKRNPKVALVLCGGAISGGAFKLGGPIVPNSFLANRKTTDMDLYLGISAGAFLSAPLSAGIPPEELFLSIRGESEKIGQFKPSDLLSELEGVGLQDRSIHSIGSHVRAPRFPDECPVYPEESSRIACPCG